jgi:hypothetical protein
LKLLEDFSNETEFELRLVFLSGKNQRENKKEAAYWSKLTLKQIELKEEEFVTHYYYKSRWHK